MRRRGAEDGLLRIRQLVALGRSEVSLNGLPVALPHTGISRHASSRVWLMLKPVDSNGRIRDVESVLSLAEDRGQ